MFFNFSQTVERANECVCSLSHFIDKHTGEREREITSLLLCHVILPITICAVNGFYSFCLHDRRSLSLSLSLILHFVLSPLLSFSLSLPTEYTTLPSEKAFLPTDDSSRPRSSSPRSVFITANTGNNKMINRKIVEPPRRRHRKNERKQKVNRQTVLGVYAVCVCVCVCV